MAPCVVAPEIVTDIERAQEVISLIQRDHLAFGFDIESRGTKLEKDAIIGLALSTRAARWYFPLNHYTELAEPVPTKIAAQYTTDIAVWTEERESGVPIHSRRFRKKPIQPKPVKLEERLLLSKPRTNNLPEPEFFAVLLPLFMSGKEIVKIAHNSPFDWRAILTAFRRHGLVDGFFIPPGLHDSLIAAYALSLHLQEQFGKLSLDWLSERLLGDAKDESDLRAWFESRKFRGVEKQKGNYHLAPIDMVARYCAHDAWLAFRLFAKLAPRVRADEGCLKLYRREMDLVAVTVQMESWPKYVDLEYLRGRKEAGEAKLEEMRQGLYKMAKRTFNPNPSGDLIEVLLERGIELPQTEKNMEAQARADAAGKDAPKTKYSTSEDVLEKFRGDALVDAIFDYRALTKRIGTDLTGVLHFADPNSGALHPNYNQTTARTGRRSSAHPNNQNLTRDDDEFAAEWSVRRAFIARPGRVYLFVDWKQIEPRWAAHLTRDKALTRVYLEKGRDLYVDIGKAAFTTSAPPKKGAKIIMPTPADLELIDKEWKAKHPVLRQAAKTLCLAMIYRIGPKGLAKKIAEESKGAVRPSIEETETLLYRLGNKYSGIERAVEFLAEAYERQGYIRNPFGRKLYLEDPKRTYPLLNAWVQSSAADMLKTAELDTSRAVEKAGLDCMLAASIHDELGFDCAIEDAEAALKIIVYEMTKYELRVPLEVDIAMTASDWSSLIEFSPSDPIPWETLGVRPKKAGRRAIAV